MTQEPKYLYRLVDDYDSEDRAILLVAFPVLRATPKGFWIGRGAGYTSQTFPREQEAKFVLRVEGGRKRFAYADKQDALRSYQQRKLRQTGLLRARLDRVEWLRLVVFGGLGVFWGWGGVGGVWYFGGGKFCGLFGVCEMNFLVGLVCGVFGTLLAGWLLLLWLERRLRRDDQRAERG